MSSVAEITGDKMGVYKAIIDAASTSIRVACPALIVSFDPASQTARVKPAIFDTIQQNGESKTIPLPIISDIPVAFPKGGDYCITLPIRAGDACILVFADSCIDEFQQSGNESVQAEIRHHDLSDAMAIVGISTGNAPVQNYNPEDLEIRHKTTNQRIALSEKGIDINHEGSIIKINSSSIEIKAGSVDINGEIF